MIILLRIFLVGLIIYLLIRSFVLYNRNDEGEKQDSSPRNNQKSSKRISKDTGEYIDFEEQK